MGSTRAHIDRGVYSVTASSVGASTWRKLDGNFTQFGMQVIPSTATTAFVSVLQGTITTASTTPLTLITANVLTGVAAATTEIVPVAQIRTNTTSLSSGSIVHYITVQP